MLRLADRGEGAEHHRGDGEEGHDLLPLIGDIAERLADDADEQRHRRELRRRGEERRHRRRRALIDVRRPHWNGTADDLEGEAGEQEHEAEDEPGIGASVERGRDAVERGLAGEAVDQRAAVEQQAR